MVRGLHRSARHIWLFRQRHLGVDGDHLRQLAHSRGHRAVIIAGPQKRNHLAADVADLGVVQNPLKPVSHVDSVFVIAHRQKHQRTAI